MTTRSSRDADEILTSSCASDVSTRGIAIVITRGILVEKALSDLMMLRNLAEISCASAMPRMHPLKRSKHSVCIHSACIHTREAFTPLWRRGERAR